MKSVLVDKIVKTDSWSNELLMETRGKVYTFLNPVSYLDALKNKEMFARFDGIFADGSLLVSAIRLLYGRGVKRRSFDMTSLAPLWLKYAEEKRKSVYIVELQCEAEHIVEASPDFLIVGMGVLMQERFLLKVKDAGFGGIGFTCGGFIHQTAKDEIDYYPGWVDRLNLRFLYRMYKEKHTRKRYLQAALLFPARFIAERLFG